MAKKGENIYKRKDGRYEGRYIRGHRMDGKPIFGYVYAYTYAEVKQTLNLAKGASSCSEHIRLIGKGSLAEFLRYWLEQKMGERIKLSTYAQYHDRVHRHIIPVLGDIALSQLTAQQVQRFVDVLGEQGLKPSTVANIAGLLNCALKKAVELRLATLNPCEGLCLPPAEDKERRPLNRAEQIRLENLAESMEQGLDLAVFLSLYAGLRIGEICALKWQDVNLFSATLTVRGTLQRVKNVTGGPAKTILLEGAPKSRHSLRQIPLTAGLAAKLRFYIKASSDEHYVLTNSNKPMEPRTLRARFAKMAAEAGLSVPFHCLRHTFSTRCLEHNFDIQTLSELLGHGSANVTMKVYAHSVFEHKRLLAERLVILSQINQPSDEPSGALLAQ